MIYLIAPHLVAPGQMETATKMAHEVGESSRKMPGFVGRIVMHNMKKPDEVWSIVCWENREAYNHWLKVRRFWWNEDDLHRVYIEGALVTEAEMFDLIAEQGDFFHVTPERGATLSAASNTGPVLIVAPHVVSLGKMDLAMKMVTEVGESAKRFAGFIGRIELISHRSIDRIWTISTWESYEYFENWLKHRKFWWTPDDVKKAFAEGALVEDAKMFNIVARQWPTHD